MPIEYKWYIPGRIFYGRSWGVHTIDEVREFNDMLLKMLQETDKTVHLVMDIREVESIPTNLSALRENLQVLRHPQVGWNIHIMKPNKSFIKLAAAFITQIFGVRHRIYQNFEEAMIFIKEVDNSIDWSLAQQDQTRS